MPSPQASTSGLSAFVLFPSVEQWKTVDNGDPLALFHAKFWGKSMAIEEKEWLKTQSTVDDISNELEEWIWMAKGKRCIRTRRGVI